MNNETMNDKKYFWFQQIQKEMLNKLILAPIAIWSVSPVPKTKSILELVFSIKRYDPNTIKIMNITMPKQTYSGVPNSQTRLTTQ